jgi:hypothetical protein
MEEMVTIPKRIAEAAAALLDLAGNEFSNHGCNDLDPKIAAMFTRADGIAYHTWNGDPEEAHNIDMDWLAMSYCEQVLRGTIKQPTTQPVER